MDRALPGWAVDLIRDGVPSRDLKAKGDKAVWTALVRTAASAHQRGQDVLEWEHLVTDPASNLGRQLATKDGKRARTARAVEKTLSAAWDAAIVWVSENGPAWDREAARAESARRAALIRDVCADADNDLDDNERAVLAYLADDAETRGMLRIPLPRRTLSAALGIGDRAARNAVARLVESGVLFVEVAGKSSASESSRRATLYAVPDELALTPYLSRETRPMGPPAQTYGTPAIPKVGTPTRPMGPPMTGTAVTVTVTDPAKVHEVIAALARAGAVEIEEAELAAGNVTPIRKRETA